MLKLLLIAVSLALDAMTVSISVGMSDPQAALKQGLRMGVWFGAFQFAMPLIGFLLGSTLSAYVAFAAPYIAFALLAFVGGRMVMDALQNKNCEVPSAAYSTLTAKKLFALAVATSIDALAVGVTFAFLVERIVPAVCLIGVITFLFSAAGVKLGNVFGLKYKSKAEFAGGVILILLGTKILLDHLGVLS